MNNRIRSIMFLALGCLLAVMVLFMTSPMVQKGGFTRKWKNVLRSEKAINLTYTGYYIAGFSDDNIFLGHKNVPLQLLNIFEDSIYAIALQSNLPVSDGRIFIDGIQVLVADYVNHVLLQGSLLDTTIHTVLMNGENFDDVAYLSPFSWIIRKIDINASTSTLVKKSLARNGDASHLLEKQVDGIFCTDGMLVATSQKVLYTYYYRNEVLVFDSSLSLTNRFHTIDTVTRANIQLAHSIQGTRQLATPPPFVNRKTTASGDFLFVNSKIKASNELAGHGSSSTIDIYRLPDGVYQGSFYLPAYRGIPMKEFRVTNGYLYSMHNQYLVTYRLMLPR